MSAVQFTRARLRDQLALLGVRPGNAVMVHASLKAVGPMLGGPAALAGALLDAVGTGGTLLAYVSWDRSPYEETLNGSQLEAIARASWPPFNPSCAGVYPGFGAFNAYLVDLPGAYRSGHPDASMVAIGAASGWLICDHPLDSAYGPGSPLERFLEPEARILLIGTPPDCVTLLHYAEAVAPIKGKRRVTYEMPLLGPSGETCWRLCEDFDSNGILDCYAIEGQPDAVERITRDYLSMGRHQEGAVGNALAQLIDARDIVDFGISWLVERHGRWQAGPDGGESPRD